MQNRWNQPIGLAVQRFSPVAFPGAPPEAFLGFTEEGGSFNPASQDTALPPVNNSFHEVGYFQTEAGPASGPAPNPDPNADANNWGRHANDPLVVQMLGRPATMVPGAWASAIDDQTAVGLASLLGHAQAVAAQLPPEIQPSDQGSLWNVALAFMGFTEGDSGAARTVNRYADALTGVPDSRKFSALADAVILDAQNNGPVGAAGSYSNPAYDVLNAWGKLETGRQLAQNLGRDASWFDMGFGDNEPAVQQAVDDAAYARTPAAIQLGYSAPAPSILSGGAVAVIVGVVVAVGVAVGGYYAYRAYQRSQLRSARA